MRTIVFDMYGVIMKDPDGKLMTFINGMFPDLKDNDIYPFWIKAAVGEIPSLDFWKSIGCRCPDEVETAYINTIEMNRDFYTAAEKLRNQFRFALLSNDISEWSRCLRKKYDLDRYFDVITVSGDVNLRKPDPEIFRLTLRELDQPASECIFVDDRIRNLATAQQLGMDVVLFGNKADDFEGKKVRSFDELLSRLLPENH